MGNFQQVGRRIGACTFPPVEPVANEPRPTPSCQTSRLAEGALRYAPLTEVAAQAAASEEYEWFFEGGPTPPISLPDVTITTEEPVYEYSWAEDEFCRSFRPFERTIRLTVRDESGVEDDDETVVVFSSPALKR